MTIESDAALAADEHVFLIGRPPVADVIANIRALAIDGKNYSDGDLMSEWRIANDRIRALEESEGGLADGATADPLPSELEPLARAAMESPVFRGAFQMVPTDIRMVELDRMVVFQKHVNLAHANRVRERLGPRPALEDVFRTCIPVDREPVPVRALKTTHNSFTFLSASRDLRFLEPTLLDADQVQYTRKKGTATSVVGLVVGYGPNVLNALHIDDRLVLGNGSHRAFALRELGFTHVPCAVQKITRMEELEVAGPDDLRYYPERYLGARRPPMLKDYFDPQLRKLVPVARKNRLVKVTFNVEITDIPAPQ